MQCKCNIAIKVKLYISKDFDLLRRGEEPNQGVSDPDILCSYLNPVFSKLSDPDPKPYLISVAIELIVSIIIIAKVIIQ